MLTRVAMCCCQYFTSSLGTVTNLMRRGSASTFLEDATRHRGRSHGLAQSRGLLMVPHLRLGFSFCVVLLTAHAPPPGLEGLEGLTAAAGRSATVLAQSRTHAKQDRSQYLLPAAQAGR